MLTGSIQIKSNHYYVVYRDQNGKQKWKSTKIKVGKTKKDKTLTERQAYAFMEQFFKEKEIEGQEKSLDISEQTAVSMPFLEFLDFWLIEIKPSIKASTFEEYSKAITGQIKPYFSQFSYTLSDLQPMYFSRYFSHLKEHGGVKKTGVSKKTINNLKSVLSSALKFAVHNNFLTSNPIDYAKLPVFNEVEKFEPVIYTPEQIKRLLDYAEKADSSVRTFLYLVAVTGARRGEILGLTWDCVDLINGTITIKHNMTGSRKDSLRTLSTPKTKNSVRTLVIPDKVIQLLTEEKDRQNDFRKLFGEAYTEYKYDFVIRQKNGSIYNHPNYVNRLVNKLMIEAGLPHCRIHDIRHYVASMLFDANVPVNQITAQLGHGQTATTEKIYVHRKKKVDALTSNILSDAIGL